LRFRNPTEDRSAKGRIRRGEQSCLAISVVAFF
jgi:hypothetical protein